MFHLRAAFLTLVATGFLASVAWAQTASSSAVLDGLVNEMYPALDALYEDIHSHPELSMQETRTAAKLAARMRELGFEVTEGVGKTGVVALLRNGAGPTVMVRTELDALPMEEKTGLPYASKVMTDWNGRQTFVAHSCGHDVHMASWVGTAQALVAMKAQWKGTLMFVAQPAEEARGGARAMLKDGLFTRFPKPNFALALHTSPMRYGYVGYRVGPITSASDPLQITFKGRGGHGSAPHMALDPIAVAAHFITDVQTVISREKDPAEFGVVTIGAIQGGTAGNIIPDSVLLRGTIRSYKPEVRKKLLAGVERTAMAAAAMAGAPQPDIFLGEKDEPGNAAVVNDKALTERAVSALRRELGADKVVEVQPITASEDFSDFAEAGVPAMFFFVGVTDPKLVEEAHKPGGKPIPINHSPFFAPVPEPSIKTSVKAMTTAVLATLQDEVQP